MRAVAALPTCERLHLSAVTCFSAAASQTGSPDLRRLSRVRSWSLSSDRSRSTTALSAPPGLRNRSASTTATSLLPPVRRLAGAGVSSTTCPPSLRRRRVRSVRNTLRAGACVETPGSFAARAPVGPTRPACKRTTRTTPKNDRIESSSFASDMTQFRIGQGDCLARRPGEDASAVCDSTSRSWLVPAAGATGRLCGDDAFPAHAGHWHRVSRARIRELLSSWRIDYYVGDRALVVLSIFKKTSQSTLRRVIETCRERLKRYLTVVGHEGA